MIRLTTSATKWLVAIVLLGAALRFIPIWFGLPHLSARPDEEVAVTIASRMAEGDLNPQFFHWPSLTFYLFAGIYVIASAIRSLVSDLPFTVVDRVIIARACVACAGTLTILVLFGVGRRMADAATGLLAALFLAVAILHVRDSHFAMTDVLMTLLLTTSLALILRAVDLRTVDAPVTPREPAAGPIGLFAAAGLAAGLATSTKYNAAALLGAMGAAQLVLLWRFRSHLRRVAVWLPAVAFTLAFAFGFICATPYAVLDYPKFRSDLEFDVTHLAGGHGINLGRGWIYHLQRSLPYGVGLTTFVAAIVGIVPMVRRYPRQTFLLAGFAIPFYVAIGSGTTVFFRYILPLVPIVCLAAAVATRQMGQWLTWRYGYAPSTITLLLTALIALPGLVNCVWFDVLLAKTDTRVVAARWLIPRLKPLDTLHDAGGEYTRLDLQHVRFREWKFNPDENSFGDPAGRTPDWLILSESPVRLYAAIPPQLRPLVQEKYDLVLSIPATQGRARAAVYDLQDAFFMPVSRFDTVVRPGPTVQIYRRKDAAPVDVDR